MEIDNTNVVRCGWVGKSTAMQHYHDTEWGVPVFNDQKWFEFLVLDAFQAGLSWAIVLNKREGFKQAFANFDVQQVAQFNENKIAELCEFSGIIRNKLKIKATVTNAQAFIKIQQEFGSFSNYIWQFTNHTTLINQHSELSQVPARSAESDKMSKDLIKRGFKFVGSTICYAFMQAAGMVNDHLTTCFRYQQINQLISNS